MNITGGALTYYLTGANGLTTGVGFPITAASASGTTVTITMTAVAGFNLLNNQTVSIAGILTPGDNILQCDNNGPECYTVHIHGSLRAVDHYGYGGLGWVVPSVKITTSQRPLAT